MTSIQLATSVTARLQESKRNKKIKHETKRKYLILALILKKRE